MRKVTTLRQALSDPDLLAHALPGPSWASWRTMLMAIVGEGLTPEERETFSHLTGGREAESGQMVDTFLAVAGRRSGKSRAMSALLVYLSCLCDWSDVLSLGERGLALFLAPSERQAANVFRYAVAILDASPALSGLVENRTADTITLSCGTDLEVAAASWRRSRGGTCIGICFDECAFAQTSDDSANRDDQIVTALKPSLATTGGPLLLTSSPSAMEGVVYKLHKRHFGPQGDRRTLVVQSDTRGLNPRLSQAVIDRAYEDDATSADAEFGGVFRQLSTAYLDRSIVEKATDATSARLTLPGLPYVCFLDPAGGTGKDSFTAAIGHKHLAEGREIAVLDSLLEYQPPFDPDTVVASISDTLKRWGITDAVSDAYAAAWPISAFARHGINLTHASLSASEIYVHVIPQFTSGRVRLLNHQRLIDQLCALKRKVAQGGREVVSHPRNSHDDLANSVAGLLWRLSPGGPVSSADNWLEYMRRELERTRGGLPQGPHFGFGFNEQPKPEPLTRLYVPAAIAAGSNVVPLDGIRYTFRFDGGRAYVEVPRYHALRLLDHDFWRADNATAADALFGERA